MSESDDLHDMIDVLTLAIAREESEELFFKRSAEASTHKIAREMFNEIAGEFAGLRKSLEPRKVILTEALADLEKSKQ